MTKPKPRSIDDAVDQALASLRNAQPPEGLETRILASLRHREAVSPLPAHAVNRRWLPAALTLATAAALLVAVHLHAPHQAVAPSTAPKPTPNLLSSTSINKTRPQPSAHCQRPAPFAHIPSPPEPPQLTSFPAPPAPLTTQEKLLLQVAQRRDQDDLNLLNPELAARELAQNMADFDRFFPPPPPFGPPAPHAQTPTPTQETPNEAHPTVR